MASIIINNIGNTILPNKTAENIIIDDIDYSKKIIICTYKEISKNEIAILKQYGKVIQFNAFMSNISPDKLDFDYLILNFKDEIHRNYYQFNFYKNNDYYYILYRFCFETNNGITFNNEINELPPKQAAKINYHKLLLRKKLESPRWYVSLFRTCFSSEQELF
jgi:hypothetical protein